MPPLTRVRRRGLAAAGISLALLPALLVLPAAASTAGGSTAGASSAGASSAGASAAGDPSGAGLAGSDPSGADPSGAAASGAAASGARVTRPAVIGRRVLGHSVQGRPIVAWHLGEPGHTKVVLLSLMHGNEPASRRILTDLRDGAPVHDLNLWVVPVYNPDGFAHGTRKNAHGVDPNRNYPYKWIRQTGNYDSGPQPASEPETRAMMRFLARIRPAYILSFHQPLHAVDVTERPKFSRRVARALGLPMTSLNCGSSCHGTMTMWFNHRFSGFALTVEYGASPPAARLRAAPDEILRLFGAWRGGVHGIPRAAG